jgi:hypothetical protein
MALEGKGPVSGQRVRWYARLWPGRKGGEAILTGANVRARSEITTLKPPAHRQWVLMGTDNLAQAPIRFVDNRPLEPQHLVTEDIQGTNPKNRGIVLGAAGSKPTAPQGIMAIKSLPLVAGKPLAPTEPWGAQFRDGSVRMTLASQRFAPGLLTEDAQLSPPRNDLPVMPRYSQFDADTKPVYRIIGSSITFTRASRLLAMVRTVLNFDVTAWLRGNKK